MYYSQAASNMGGQINRAINLVIGKIGVDKVAGGNTPTTPGPTGNEAAQKEIKRLSDQQNLLKERYNKIIAAKDKTIDALHSTKVSLSNQVSSLSNAVNTYKKIVGGAK